MKKIMMMGAAVLAGVMGVVMAQPTYAEGGVTCPPGSVNSSATTLAECNLTHTENDLMENINTIINVIIGVIGLVAVIVIVIGGLTYVMSTGDAAKLKRAKDTILYGVIGLIIALLAFAIVNFVLISVFSKSSSGGGGGDDGGGDDGGGGSGYVIDVRSELG